MDISTVLLAVIVVVLILAVFDWLNPGSVARRRAKAEQRKQREEAEERARRLSDLHSTGRYLPEETDLYMQFQHCGKQAELVTEAVFCLKQPGWLRNLHSGEGQQKEGSLIGQYLDEHHSLWQCPQCRRFFWRYFYIDTKSGTIRAIPGTYIVENAIQPEEADIIRAALDACPKPKAPHECSCRLHKSARESGDNPIIWLVFSKQGPGSRFMPEMIDRKYILPTLTGSMLDFADEMRPFFQGGEGTSVEDMLWKYLH